jgi:hypothetical protein
MLRKQKPVTTTPIHLNREEDECRNAKAMPNNNIEGS